MSQTLMLELSDEIYAIIQNRATASGTSPAHWLAKRLEQQYGFASVQPSAQTQDLAAAQAARERFERHIGEVSIVEAIGADNQQIDADLSAEYENSNEAL